MSPTASPRVSSERGESGPAMQKCASEMGRLRRAESVLGGFKKPAHWVLVFGNFLAMSAGIVNAISIRMLGVMVTNMTGNWSNTAYSFEGVVAVTHDQTHTHTDVIETLEILLSFLFGAFICGVLIDKNQVRFGGKSWYGAALIGNSLLLITAAFVDKRTAAMSAAMASGLQNAMCTSHFGAIVRTTHVTGTVTDIGSTLGRIAMIFMRTRCKGRSMNIVDRAEVTVDVRKLKVLVPILGSFGVGCFLGAWLSAHLNQASFLVPAGITGAVGLVYTCFREPLKQIMKTMKTRRRQQQGANDCKITGVITPEDVDVDPDWELDAESSADELEETPTRESVV